MQLSPEENFGSDRTHCNFSAEDGLEKLSGMVILELVETGSNHLLEEVISAHHESSGSGLGRTAILA